MSYEGMDAQELGSTIYRRGMAIETNPFQDGTVEFKAFKKGWNIEHKKVSRLANKMYKQAKRCSPN